MNRVGMKKKEERDPAKDRRRQEERKRERRFDAVKSERNRGKAERDRERRRGEAGERGREKKGRWKAIAQNLLKRISLLFACCEGDCLPLTLTVDFSL